MVSHPYCTWLDVKDRLQIPWEDDAHDSQIDRSCEEASCYVDSRISCYVDVPLTMSNCCIRYATADFATSIYKRRTFKSKAGFESFDTRFWWEMAEKKLEECIKSTWKCPTIEITDR